MLHKMSYAVLFKSETKEGHSAGLTGRADYGQFCEVDVIEVAEEVNRVKY